MKKMIIGQINLTKVLLVVFFLLVFSNPSPAAQWAKIYLGTSTVPGVGSLDSATVIRQTLDGGYIVAGYTGRPDVNPAAPMIVPPLAVGDFWVLKLGAAGEVTWQKTYGGEGIDQAISIQETSDGGYIVAGWTTSFGTEQGTWILKLDRDGNIEWQKTYGGSGATTIQQTSEGGYIVLGHHSPGGETLVLKLDGDGNIQWQKAYGDTGPSSIQQTSDGAYILVGSLTGDMWVSKLDINGNIELQMAYGSPGSEWGDSIRQTADGGYIVAGGARISEASDSDVLVLKLNGDGSIAWQKSYGGPTDDWARSLERTSDGGYVVVGTIYSFGAGEDDIWALKLNDDGNIEWQMAYGTSGYEWGNSIQQTADGGYIVAGGKGFFVLKLDSHGDVPGCSIARVSDATVKDTNIIGADASATGIDTAIVPFTSSAVVVPTKARVIDLCFPAQELISAPSFPNGPSFCLTDTSYNFTTGGASSSLGHSVEYRFSWGDGTYSDWSLSADAEKSWASPGRYRVRAEARCYVDTFVESEWTEPLEVTVSSSLSDLTGQWKSLTQTCRNTRSGLKCRVSGRLRIQNVGNLNAPKSFVWFYLSDNDHYDGDGIDVYLKQVATGTVRVGKTKTKTFSYSLPLGETASGKYIIAVIDKDNTVAEANENNNYVVSERIP